jgi:hypothetical protein
MFEGCSHMFGNDSCVTCGVSAMFASTTNASKIYRTYVLCGVRGEPITFKTTCECVDARWNKFGVRVIEHARTNFTKFDVHTNKHHLLNICPGIWNAQLENEDTPKISDTKHMIHKCRVLQWIAYALVTITNDRYPFTQHTKKKQHTWQQVVHITYKKLLTIACIVMTLRNERVVITIRKHHQRQNCNCVYV